MNAVSPTDNTAIETAVAAALSETAAMTMIRIAVDPDGTRTRLEELSAATRAHDQAREAAEQATADAERAKADAEAKLAGLEAAKAEFETWRTNAEAELKGRADAAAERDAELDVRARGLDALAANLKAAAVDHAALVTQIRGWLLEHDVART
jgi:chromosome segregation ATPase